jgi:hypothetical protein
VLRASPYTSSLERRCLSPEPIDLHVYFDDHSDILPIRSGRLPGQSLHHVSPHAPARLFISRF